MPRKEVAKRVVLIITTGIAILFAFLVATLSIAGYYAYSQFQTFSNHAGVDLGEMRSLVTSIMDNEPQTTEGKTNILILGVDTLSTRADSPPLTDTMMIASINTHTGKINMLSLPRDLWSEPYQTKINALYYYGQDRYPNNPQQFPKEVLEELLGVPIHHTMVISMDSLAKIVDLLEGVEVDVPVGFTDTEFPRPDVDVTTESDPTILYKTVVFETGPQTMSGNRVLEYIRSRKSGDDEGTDDARSGRQQIIINALFEKIMHQNTITNPGLLGDLYRYYQDEYEQYVSLVELGTVLKSLLPHRDILSISAHSLSMYPELDDGVIWHPPTKQYQGQWVYAIKDKVLLQSEISEKLLDKTVTASKD